MKKQVVKKILSKRKVVANFFEIFLLVNLFLSSGCQTLHHQDASKLKQGYWSAKVLVRDDKADKSFILNFKIYSIKNQKLRIDILTPAGYHLSSLLLTDHLAYYLTQSKQYYEGPATARALKPLINFPLSPRFFYSFLFEEDLGKGGWDCHRDAQGFLLSCEQKKKKVLVSWKNRNLAKKMVEVEGPKIKIQILLEEFSERFPKTESQLFQLKIPDSFTRI